MEPMNLGSPTNSASNSSMLPSFLMGEPLTPISQRNITLSPTKQGRTLVGSPTSSPKDSMGRAATAGLRGSLFTSHTTAAHNNSSLFNGQNNSNLNTSVSGPPTQSLFDTLHMDGQHGHLMQTATSSPRVDPQALMSPPQPPHYSHHPTSESQQLYSSPAGPLRPLLPGPKHNFTSSPQIHATAVTSHHHNQPPQVSEFWVTVFGFPHSATKMILSHFSQCGNIVDKMHPHQSNGNWIHLRFTSRLECDKALNYNEKILNNYCMVGVTRCKDAAVLERERGGASLDETNENNSFACNTSSLNMSTGSMNRTMGGGGGGVRPLAHTAYKTMQSPIAVSPSPNAPARSTGLVDKAMNFIFGA